MHAKLHDSQSAELKDTILASEADAIDIELQTQIVIVGSQASVETFEELITATGYSLTKREQ